MPMNKAQLEKSRDLWVKRERDYKAKAAEAHENHQKRSQQLRDLTKPRVSVPLAHILQDSWGYHPPVHDGIDLICPPNEPLLAICDGEVIRADAAGWWGKGAPADPVLKAKGDGVIVLRCSVNKGPFREGLNFVYGHAEGATVKAGTKVRAGDVIGHAGFANAYHTHFCVNGRTDAKGVGDRDPRPYVDWATRNS